MNTTERIVIAMKTHLNRCDKALSELYIELENEIHTMKILRKIETIHRNMNNIKALIPVLRRTYSNGYR